MEGEGEGGLRLSKRINNGEVDYKTKSGTAWSHSYLNQKPWHPLSYPNQRRKWIAEQTHANHERRSEEVAREYAQEQEFFRQTALVSKKEKEKIEMMKAVSFMYVRPPGYNAESAKAAEIDAERQKEEQDNRSQDPATDGASTAMPEDAMPGRGRSGEEKKKPRPKDVFGRHLPTEEEFEVLKNAPRLETGLPARSKPFGVEVRNVKCVRCGTYGHQSGDRECLLKDAIMPNEESRLKRDDPLTAILAHTDSSEPLKWELKQKPGMSPPRGGFKQDDPNQQIVAEEDIFDEYGGFLGGDNIPELLTNFSSSKPKNKKSKRKSKQKRHSSPSNRELRAPDEDGLSSPSDILERRSKKEKKHKKKKRNPSESSLSENSELERHHRKSRHKHYSSEDSDSNRHHKSKRSRQEHSYSSLSEDDTDKHYRSEKNRQKHSYLGSSEEDSRKRHRRSEKSSHKHYSSEDSDSNRHHKSKRSRQKHSYSSEDDTDRHYRSEKNKQKHSYLGSSEENSRKQYRSEKSRQKCSYSQDSNFNGHNRSKRHRRYHHHRQRSESISE